MLISLKRNTPNSWLNKIVGYLFRFAFLTILLVLLASCNKSFDVGLAPGQFAPDFELKTLSGEKIKLSDLRGKNVLLNFWASWCIPCLQEAPSLERLSKLNPEKLIVLGVAVDDELEDVAKFVKDHQVSFPIILDDQSDVKNKFDVVGFPESFFIDHQGKIKLILDPDKQTYEAKISGPRAWDQAPLSQQLLKIDS